MEKVELTKDNFGEIEKQATKIYIRAEEIRDKLLKIVGFPQINIKYNQSWEIYHEIYTLHNSYLIKKVLFERASKQN